MTSGEMKFFIDEVECPNTNGVGTNAIGGLFNCGLTGTTFRVECTTFCDAFVIVEIFLWKDKALSLDYENRNYNINQGFKTPGIENVTPIWTPQDVSTPIQVDSEKVFRRGSYWYHGNDWPNLYIQENYSGGTYTYPHIAF